jgi:hypothetical protein
LSAAPGTSAVASQPVAHPFYRHINPAPNNARIPAPRAAPRIPPSTSLFQHERPLQRNNCGCFSSLSHPQSNQSLSLCAPCLPFLLPAFTFTNLFWDLRRAFGELISRLPPPVWPPISFTHQHHTDQKNTRVLKALLDPSDSSLPSSTHDSTLPPTLLLPAQHSCFSPLLPPRLNVQRCFSTLVLCSLLLSSTLHVRGTVSKSPPPCNPTI